MDQDQFSNATRPSTNYHSFNLQQNQTNTSQHNPLLSTERISEQNHTQNEIQQIQPHRHHSQQLNNYTQVVEKQLSLSQRPAIHQDISEGKTLANQQNQLSLNQNNMQAQRSQWHINSKQEYKNEQELLIQGYQEEVLSIKNLNRDKQQNYNQNKHNYQEKGASVVNSQIESDLLDFGPIIEEQIQRYAIQERSHNKEYDYVQFESQQPYKQENASMKMQIEIKKDIPMDIEGQSKGYLTEKESHKSFKLYHQRQSQWEKYEQKVSNQSKASQFGSVPFYQQKMPQNNSNLFKFGFTMTSKQKNRSEIKKSSQQTTFSMPKIEKKEQKQSNTEKEQVNQLKNLSNKKNQNQQQQQSNKNIEIVNESAQKLFQQSQKVQIKVITQQSLFQIKNSPKQQIHSQQQKVNIKAQPQELNDQLPSQVPADQFQIVSNIFKENQAFQIQFESISAISVNQKPCQLKSYEVQTNIQKNSLQIQNNQMKNSKTVIQKLEKIFQNKDHLNDQQNLLQFQSLIKSHINLITLRPIDYIGQKIFENGQYLMKFIELLALNSPDGQDRRLYLKYISYSLSRYVKVNTEVYQKFKLRFWQLKSDKFTITDCFNLKNTPKKQQKNQQQHENEQRYSVEVHDSSVHNDPRSVMKSNNKQRIKEYRTEIPVPRNGAQIRQSKFIHQNEKESKQTILIGSLKRQKKSKQTKRRVQVHDQKQNTPQKSQKLGFAQTFVTIEDRNGNQVLQKRKVSLRLLEKSNKQKSHSKQINISKSRQKKKSPQKQQNKQNTQQNRKKSPKPSTRKRGNLIRTSVGKLQNEQVLTADYVKSHFQQLKIDTSKMKNFSGKLLTEADRQIAKILEQYQKLAQQQDRLALDLQASQVPPFQQPQRQIVQNTNNTVSRQRVRQIEQQLQKNKLKKYKIMQQLTEKHIVIDTIIDPDVNNHGIYALVKVTKMTSVFCGALYFLIPMSKLDLCSRDRINQDINKIQSLVQEGQKDNIGILKPTTKIQEAIEAEKTKRAKLYR